MSLGSTKTHLSGTFQVEMLNKPLGIAFETHIEANASSPGLCML